MAWIAVDREGRECICNVKPDIWCLNHEDYGIIQIPNGSIKKLIGRVLTWGDEPVEVKCI